MPFTPEHQARIDAGRRATYARRRAEWDALTEPDRWDRVLEAFACELAQRFGELTYEPCWPWNEYCVRRNTYGTFSRMGLGDYAHRLSYRLAHGDIPAGAEVRHSCDYRPCCNPRHVLTGSHQENMRDAQERERLWSPQKITDAEVREMVGSYHVGGISMTQLAQMYGVSVTTVSEIVNGKKRRRAFAV